MKWVDSIQTSGFQKAMRQALQKRAANKEAINWRNVRHIGILIDVTHQESALSTAQAYSRKLEGLQKETHIVAYSDTPLIPEGLGVPCFGKKDQNWSLIPKGAVVQEFLAQPLDIVILLTTERVRQLEYLAAACKASMCIGIYTPETDGLYDLSFRLKTSSLDMLLNQIDKYLPLINQKRNRITS